MNSFPKLLLVLVFLYMFRDTKTYPISINKLCLPTRLNSCGIKLGDGINMRKQETIYNRHQYCQTECFDRYQTKSKKWNGCSAQAKSERKGLVAKKNRPLPFQSTTSQVVSLRESLKTCVPEYLHEVLRDDEYIVMDTELKAGIGGWATKWDHVAEVYAVKFKGQEYVALYWSANYIEASSIRKLKKEWIKFCAGIKFVYYYASSRCDEVRMSYLLDEGKLYNYVYIDALTQIAQKIMSTDVNNKSKIYVLTLGLADQETSYIYAGDVPLTEKCEFENVNKLKVINDVQNLHNLILLARFIVGNRNGYLHSLSHDC